MVKQPAVNRPVERQCRFESCPPSQLNGPIVLVVYDVCFASRISRVRISLGPPFSGTISVTNSFLSVALASSLKCKSNNALESVLRNEKYRNLTDYRHFMLLVISKQILGKGH